MNEIAPIVFVVDDDNLFRRSTERLIRVAGWNVQSFASASDFLKNPRPEGPACLVLDVHMPGLSGMDLQQELARMGLDIPIIFITGRGDIPMSVRAIKAGAMEFLAKPFRGPVLIAAIRSAIEKDRSALEKRVEIRNLRERYNQLTPREREVLVLIAEGLLNKQVAGKLKTTEATVKFHRGHIMKKMGVDSLVSLIRMTEKLGVKSQS
jgi:FixJ family two-component response regulator